MSESVKAFSLFDCKVNLIKTNTTFMSQECISKMNYWPMFGESLQRSLNIFAFFLLCIFLRKLEPFCRIGMASRLPRRRYSREKEICGLHWEVFMFGAEHRFWCKTFWVWGRLRIRWMLVLYWNASWINQETSIEHKLKLRIISLQTFFFLFSFFR